MALPLFDGKMLHDIMLSRCTEKEMSHEEGCQRVSKAHRLPSPTVTYLCIDLRLAMGTAGFGALRGGAVIRSLVEAVWQVPCEITLTVRAPGFHMSDGV